MIFNRRVKIIILGVVMSFMQVCPVNAVEYYTYRQKTGSDIFDFSWELTVSENNVVKVSGNGEFYENICDQTCQTLQWHYISEDTDITATRDNDVIRMEGISNNRPFIKGFKIDHHPWYQPLSYSLRCFIDSEEKETFFWMIRPDTLDVIKFKVRKLQKERLIFQGQSIMALKLELGLTSLLEGLWRAHYWFRMDEGIFIRYRGVHGMPGAPETIVQLIE